MLTKNTQALSVKAGPEDGLSEGEFIVYPSTFIKEPDCVGDIVAKGAFAESIKSWKASGNTLPGLYGHRMDDPDFFVAAATDMGEDEHGLWVKGVFDLESPKGKQVYRLVKGKRLNQLSFAYDTVDQGPVQLKDGRTANELRKLNIHEFSFVPVGANQDTSVVAVKSILEQVATEIKAGRVLSAKNEGYLRTAYDAIGDVLGISTEPATEEKASDTDPLRQAPPEEVGQPREASQSKSSVNPSALLNAITAQIAVEIAY